MQAHGGDYDLTYSLVSKMYTLRVLLSLAAQLNLEIHQMDVTISFLNAILDDVIYFNPPPGYEYLVPAGKSIRLLKALYGLKQAPCVWNTTLDTFLRQVAGMKPSGTDRCMYKRYKNGKLKIVILVYVDDMLLMATDMNTLENAKNTLKRKFKMKDMGIARWYLCMNIIDDQQGITINQTQYIQEILQRFKMEYGKETSTPMAANKDFKKLLFSDENDKPKHCPIEK